MRRHHETVTPQAVAILAAGVAIYGGRLVAWVITKTKGPRRV